MNSIKNQWENIKEAIQKEYNLTEISYKTWILPLKLYKVEGDTVTILIPSDQSHALNYISTKYKSYFQVTISEMMNHTYNISFILEKDSENEVLPVNNSTKSLNILNSEKANLNPKYNFDNFVVGSNNTMAQSAALAVAESPGELYNPLFIYGGAGLGKTHLIHSIGNFIINNNPNKKVLYVTSEKFTNDVIESIRSGSAASMNKLREKYRTVDVLLLDDVQFIIGKDRTQEEFFHTFNALYEAGKQIVISSDKPPKQMETLEERYTTRFSWGLIADIQPPGYETRMAILQNKNMESQIKIDDSILEYIAENIKSNIRELEGALNKVIAYSKLNNVSITMENAKEALKDMIYPDKPKEITPSLIVEVVAEHFGITTDDIISKRRNSEFVIPRQIAMYLIRDLTDYSLANIGKVLGKKDHTTVMHGVEKIEKEVETNSELRNKIEIIKKKINPV